MDPITLGAVGAGVGGLGGLFGSILTNSSNRDIAEANNRFNASQAQLNRDFQMQMSNTAHQREVADLKAAGLNPLLSANAGSSSPGGATASSSGNPVMQNPLADLNLGGMFRDLAQLDMQRQSTQADVRVKDAQAAATISNTKMDPTRKELMLQQIKESEFRSHPNSLDQLLTRYIERFAKYLETNASQGANRRSDITRKFIESTSPEDWSKLQNAFESRMKGK